MMGLGVKTGRGFAILKADVFGFASLCVCSIKSTFPYFPFFNSVSNCVGTRISPFPPAVRLEIKKYPPPAIPMIPASMPWAAVNFARSFRF